MFNIEYVASNAIENYPFEIDRHDGSYRYIFFHFTSKVIIKINNETIIANPGSCILYAPRFPQAFKAFNSRLNHDYVDFTIDDNTFFEKIKFPLNTLLYPRMSEDISKLIAEMYKEHKEALNGYELMSDSLLTELFVKILRKISHKSISRKNYDDTLKEKFEKMRLNMYQCPDNIEVSTLVNQLGFSPSRFNYLYKKFFNVSPINDLTIARKLRVKEMIENNMSTKEIIKAIGFESEEYFYRWFKKEFNMTKNEYEELNSRKK